ncbi:MAG: hydroxyacylglutathione hydrolase [Albidovulum sp.]|nr:hydroxyacylglutathione hydrolase [Albidovulum sp.]
MTLEIVTVPCLSDNYAYLIRDDRTGATAVVDAPHADPIAASLASRGWRLDKILITHHHFDHIGGVERLKRDHGATIVGAASDSSRLPPLDEAVSEGDSVAVGDAVCRILDVSGHTVGHIAYVFPGAAFTADSLMALGCGRVFEGTAEMMWSSLSKLAALPPDTEIYSGHEYTAANARFAMTVEPDNETLKRREADIARLRSENRPTVPSTLSLELETNPFLRARLDSVKASMGMPGASDAAAFAEIRKRKDNF